VIWLVGSVLRIGGDHTISL